VIFLVVKAYNRMKRAEQVDDEPSEEILLLREIRDGISSH
jgi:large-conductance mechanosensitive channel